MEKNVLFILFFLCIKKIIFVFLVSVFVVIFSNMYCISIYIIPKAVICLLFTDIFFFSLPPWSQVEGEPLPHPSPFTLKLRYVTGNKQRTNIKAAVPTCQQSLHCTVPSTASLKARGIVTGTGTLGRTGYCKNIHRRIHFAFYWRWAFLLEWSKIGMTTMQSSMDKIKF